MVSFIIVMIKECFNEIVTPDEFASITPCEKQDKYFDSEEETYVIFYAILS